MESVIKIPIRSGKSAQPKKNSQTSLSRHRSSRWRAELCDPGLGPRHSKQAKNRGQNHGRATANRRHCIRHPNASHAKNNEAKYTPTTLPSSPWSFPPLLVWQFSTSPGTSAVLVSATDDVGPLGAVRFVPLLLLDGTLFFSTHVFVTMLFTLPVGQRKHSPPE